MKKIIIVTLIGVIIGMLIFRYGFFIISYLTTPPDRNISFKESSFIDSLENSYICHKVRVEPMWGNNIGRKRPYSVIIFSCKSNLEGDSLIKTVKLEQEAFQIAKRAYSIQKEIADEFNPYRVTYRRDMGNINYEFNVDKLKKQYPPVRLNVGK